MSSVVVGWDGRFTVNLQVAGTSGGSDCHQAHTCKIFVPDLVWDRPTGRPEASAAIIVSSAAPAPEFTAASPPLVATVGHNYSYTFQATGNPQYRVSGQPSWLSINAQTGTVSGTPPAALAGLSFSYAVTAFNSQGSTTAGPFTVRVAPGAIPHWRIVRLGDTGLNVRTLQHLLRVHGEAVAVDGIFGPQTAKAVRRFQHARLIPEATVGDQTWPALIVQLSRGARGEAVRAAQEQLAARSLPQTRGLRVDGNFGVQTERAVLGLQNYVHQNHPNGEDLQVNGIIDVHTWRALEIGLLD